MGKRFDRSYAAGLYVAQEARRADMRSGDFDYARGEGAARFERASEHIDTGYTREGASGCGPSVASHGESACGVEVDSEARCGAPGPVAAPQRSGASSTTAASAKAPAGVESPALAGPDFRSHGASVRGTRHDDRASEHRAKHPGDPLMAVDWVDDEIRELVRKFDQAQQGSLFGLRTLRFDLPMPPSVNEAWIDIAYRDKDDGKLKVRRALTDAHRDFRSHVGGIVRGVMLRAQARDKPLLGRLELLAFFHYRDRRRTDIGNREKPLTDALTHAGAYRDDSQIDDSRLRRIVEPGCEERCIVCLREIAA